MIEIRLPYDDVFLRAEVPSRNLLGVFAPNGVSRPTGKTQREIVREALASPISSPRLVELARGKKKMVVITSDHTRPVPSGIIMPLILEEARRGNPEMDVTILVATGFHRATTQPELIAKFGERAILNLLIRRSSRIVLKRKMNNEIQRESSFQHRDQAA
ncbi:MAG: DUF2088 domain-containing protein [Kiritimatiellaeota bacterium]|nr:DUF2088 domain-containing protein [Kiritimatiellota bacterium]